jgi:hypothetical protein
MKAFQHHQVKQWRYKHVLGVRQTDENTQNKQTELPTQYTMTLLALLPALAKRMEHKQPKML